MKKKLLVVILALLAAIALCACGGDEKKPPDPGYNEWTTVETTSKSMYDSLVSGTTNLLTDFTIDNFNKNNNNLFANGKAVVIVNGLKLWATLGMNYVNNNKDNAMLSFMICTQEDSYKDMLVGVFLYNKICYIAMGDSKFKFEMTPDVWSQVFPFKSMNMTLEKKNNIATVLGQCIMTERNEIKAEERTLANNSIETRYTVDIDFPATLTKIDSLMNAANSSEENKAFVNKIYGILANVLGISVDNIKKGEMPDSDIGVNFSVVEGKLTDFNANISIDQSGKYSNVLFDGEDINISIDFLYIKTSKFAPVSIDFANSETKQKEYVHYIDKTFKIVMDIDKDVVQDGVTVVKPYELVLTTKVFQQQNVNNYVFMEYYRIDGNKKILEQGLYVYNNVMYLFCLENNVYKCKLSGNIDLTLLANKIISNELLSEGERAKFDGLNLASYLFGVLALTKDELKIHFNDRFFVDLWFNYGDMIKYIDNLFTENVFEIDAVKQFISFAKDGASIAKFKWDEEFIFLVDEQEDTDIKNALGRLENPEPEQVLTNAVAG